MIPKYCGQSCSCVVQILVCLTKFLHNSVVRVLLALSRSGVALQLVQNSCPELDICFSRAVVNLKSAEAGLVGHTGLDTRAQRLSKLGLKGCVT